MLFTDKRLEPHELPLRRQNLRIKLGVRSVLLLLFIPVFTPALASPTSSIFGLWSTQKNHGRVLIEPCGHDVCAKVIDGDQLRANPAQTDVHNPDPAQRIRLVKGLYILQGYRGGPTHWEGGTVYDPQTGDESSDSTLELLADGTLQVEGCKFVLCRSEIWSRER